MKAGARQIALGRAEMDSGAEFFLLALAGIFVCTIGLGIYIYAAYRYGQWLGRRAPIDRSLRAGILRIALACQPISLWPFLADWNGFMKVGIAMAFYVLNAFPLSVGYGSAIETRREQSKRRFRKNVDDWLSEWECEPAHHAAEEEE